MLAAEAAAALEDLPAVKPGSGRFYLWLMEAIAWDNLGWSRAQEAARACLLDILAALRNNCIYQRSDKEELVEVETASIPLQDYTCPT